VVKLSRRTVYISGSFEKHYDGMLRKIGEFERDGFTVMSQKSAIITFPSMDVSTLLRVYPFINRLVILKREATIINSDVFYLYNPGGHVESRNAAELGFAIGNKKLVFAEETPSDGTLREFCPTATLAQINERLFAFKKTAVSQNIGVIQL
jgi:hypothetical protein